MDYDTSCSLDYNLAYSCYPRGGFDPKSLNAEIIRPAYLVSTEHLEKSVTAFGNVGGDILTVAASGDQPMLYALRGSRHVDTFDITFSAKAIMDIKTAALRRFNYAEYKKLMFELYKSQLNNTSIVDVIGMDEILSLMPADTSEFVRRMSNCGIFSAGLVAPDQAPYMPTEGQYEQMRKLIHRPFNFKWCNLTQLHTKLTMRYDIINTSNIFEWCGPASVRPVLKNLFPHLKPNGYICATVFWSNDYIETTFEEVESFLSGRGRVSMDSTMRETLICLRRVR